MYETRQSNSFDLCPDCRYESQEHDRFRRHCGIELAARTWMLAEAERATAELNAAAYATAPLAPMPERRPVSAPLVKLVTAELPALDGTGWARRFTLVLISLPIWLMMILLSPFDAYAATKAIAQRM
jgi:hypothetical protein